MRVPFVSFLPMEKELNTELREAFDRVFKRSWYIEGSEDAAFEKAFAGYCGAEYCVGVGNGLDAIVMALKALGIGAGDEVIVPSNTYIATALAVTYVGATPVFVEPDIKTYNINPELIEEKISADRNLRQRRLLQLLSRKEPRRSRRRGCGCDKQQRACRKGKSAGQLRLRLQISSYLQGQQQPS